MPMGINKKNRVDNIFRWYRDTMRTCGIKVNYPKNTSPDKTYMYRAFVRFADKTIEWEFDDDTTRLFIGVAVAYAKSRKLLNKGAWLLTMEPILKICYKKLKDNIKDDYNIMNLVKNSKRRIERLRTQNSEIVEILVEPINFGGYARITIMYKTGEISAVYLSLSKICRKALSRLNTSDRLELPPNRELLKMRTRILSSNEVESALRKIMGSDLLEFGS